MNSNKRCSSYCCEKRECEDETEAAVQQRRRASLNIQFDPSSILAENENKTGNEKWLKAQRRKSASSILSNNIENLKIQEQVINSIFKRQNLQ